MSGLTLKRLLVIIISQILGVVAGWFIIKVVFDLLPYFSAIQVPQGRSIGEYGIQYFLWTAVPLGIMFMIWLDKFLDTRILPD
jgi:hypothetical protein